MNSNIKGRRILTPIHNANTSIRSYASHQALNTENIETLSLIETRPQRTIYPAAPLDYYNLQTNVLKPVPLHKRWHKQLRSPLWFCLLLAVLVRIWLVIHTNGFIDGDEALVGIQAQHILRGELPIYFYNQPYMGSLEAYFMALLFAITGSSVWALRAEPILLSLVVVWLTWKLASLLAETAHLPSYARQWFTTIAALLAAIPPLYDTVLELRTLGGYIEIFVLMLLLLISVLQLTHRQQMGASSRELAWRWAGIGFLVGLGFWVNPLIICALLAASLWLLAGFLQLRRQNKSTPFGFLVRKYILPTFAALPACILGLVPALLWGAANQWQNFTYLVQLGGNTPLRPEVQAQYPTRQAIALGVTNLYTTCVGPRVIGGALPGENAFLTFLHTPSLILGLFCILITTILVLFSFAWHNRYLLRIRQLAALPLLFAACSAFIFCATKTPAIGLWNCQYDLAGRYATPLMLVLPFFFAALFVILIMLELHIRDKGQEQLQIHELLRITPPRLPFGARLGLHSMKAVLGIALGVVLLSLYLQGSTYGLTDPESTFQSPYCTNAPANNDAIIAYLQREHIHYVWANNWIAYPLVFKTNGSIIASDPLPVIRNIPILDRIPAYTDAVRHADRPSMLVLVKQQDHHPQLLKLLDSKHITYHVARFYSVPGIDLLVVTPINRTISPFESNSYFNIFFCSRDS